LELHRLMVSDTTTSSCVRLLEAAVLGGGGLKLQRDGQLLTLKPLFRAYLEEAWLPFARDALRALLAWGICPVVLLPEPPPPFFDEDAQEAQAQARSPPGGRAAPPRPTNAPPSVLDVSRAQLSFDARGPHGLQRLYRATAIGAELEDDEGRRIPDSHVFVANPPLDNGEVVSVMTAVAPRLSFVAQLREHALAAESVRSRQSIVTSVQPKQYGKGADLYDPSSSPPAGDSNRRAPASLAAAEALRAPAAADRPVHGRREPPPAARQRGPGRQPPL